MPRKMLPLALLMVAVLAPISGQAETLITLKSVTVDLPDSERTFPGPGADAVNNNCLACHSAGMVLNQPVLTKSAWQAEVTKMIQNYKAPVSEEDVAAIVDYLASMKAAE
jgi:mono/diheme cytochrome c family protein